MSVDYVKVAFEIASKAHRGQKDKAGMDYIEHPKKVAGFVQLRTEKATAYLHDVLEDTAVTANDLLNQGIPIEVVEDVQILTKKRNQNYDQYLEEVKKNKIARIVKLADLKHNSDLTRINNPRKIDFERCEKYKKAIEYLR